jgi:DNA-binding response OmpR family regulator
MEVYNKKILIADQDKYLSFILSKKLASIGYKIFLASTVHEALFFFLKKSLTLLF